MTPTRDTVADQEKAELEALLASRIFARSARQAELLRYVCEEYFNGRSAQVKEYSLATEVLKRPASFDPGRDAIVRVEFFRIRKKLKEYYEGDGAGHELYLTVQPGQYVPQFIRKAGDTVEDDEAGPAGNATAPVPAESVSSPDPPPTGRQAGSGPDRGALWLAEIALAIAAAVGAVALLRHFAAPVPQRPERPAESSPPAPAVNPAALSGAVRIAAGYLKGTYVGRDGRVWEGDRYYSGGEAMAQPREFIARTSDPALFQTLRRGEFSYDIPLRPGNYELSLYFEDSHYGPDTLSGGGETSRMFDVTMNGRPLLHLFDIINDAGGNNIADARTFKDVSPASDGKLHLQFRPLIDSPILDAIEIVPAPAGRINPIRIVAQENSYTDREGHLWEPDTDALGGQLAVHLHRAPVTGTQDPDLYVGERFGNFSYAIPVPPGKYGVTLHFAETYWGVDNQRPGAGLPDYHGSPEGGVGSRVFDVYFNGRTLLKDFDIFKAAGGADRALDKTFHGLEPNAQGKLEFSFVPDVDYACVNAIEVEDESR